MYNFSITFDTVDIHADMRTRANMPDDVGYDSLSLMEAAEDFQKIAIDPNGEYIATLWINDAIEGIRRFSL